MTSCYRLGVKWNIMLSGAIHRVSHIALQFSNFENIERASHAMVAVDALDKFYLFGGTGYQPTQLSKKYGCIL